MEQQGTSSRLDGVVGGCCLVPDQSFRDTNVEGGEGGEARVIVLWGCLSLHQTSLEGSIHDDTGCFGGRALGLLISASNFTFSLRCYAGGQHT